MPEPHSLSGTLWESCSDPSKLIHQVCINPSSTGPPPTTSTSTSTTDYPPAAPSNSCHVPLQFWPTSTLHPTTLTRQTTPDQHHRHPATPAAPPPAHRPAHAHNTTSPSQNSSVRWRWMGSSKTSNWSPTPIRSQSSSLPQIQEGLGASSGPRRTRQDEGFELLDLSSGALAPPCQRG